AYNGKAKPAPLKPKGAAPEEKGKQIPHPGREERERVRDDGAVENHSERICLRRGKRRRPASEGGPYNGKRTKVAACQYQAMGVSSRCTKTCLVSRYCSRPEVP